MKADNKRDAAILMAAAIVATCFGAFLLHTGLGFMVLGGWAILFSIACNHEE